MNNPADNMYCMVSFADKDGTPHKDLGHPKILKIQGVVWFATEELAFQYYMMLDEKYREDHVYPMLENDLSNHFDVESDYIKKMKTETRLTRLAGKPGVLVGQGPSFEEAINNNERLELETK
tara:strand:+ start:9 stop:374 length:366 start_codon:yes stop_codon:yes gene_type:complete